MKRMYEKPMAYVEEFMANQSVSACIVGSIQCVYPGTRYSKGDNGKYDDYKDGDDKGWWLENNDSRFPHGACGLETPLSFDTGTAIGYEIKGGKKTNIQLTNIRGSYKQEPGVYTGVYWESNDGYATYHHKGRLTIESVDTQHPNHS